jgi:hypothetical protein
MKYYYYYYYYYYKNITNYFWIWESKKIPEELTVHSQHSAWTIVANRNEMPYRQWYK